MKNELGVFIVGNPKKVKTAHCLIKNGTEKSQGGAESYILIKMMNYGLSLSAAA